jgi:DNA-binding NarL/FixJ family response regulator
VASGAGAMNPAFDPSISSVTTNSVRVLIADDHPVLRFGLRTMLEVSGLNVIAEASTGTEALQFALALHPDVILMDVDMPDIDGIEATRQIRAALPEVRVLMLTMFHDDAALLAAIRAGAHGYILKSTQQSEIPHAVRAVAAGQVIFGAGVAERMLEAFVDLPTIKLPFPELTAREREILGLLAQRCPNAVIAQRLNLSVKTVRNYVTCVLTKLKAVDRHEAGQMARQAGLG